MERHVRAVQGHGPSSSHSGAAPAAQAPPFLSSCLSSADCNSSPCTQESNLIPIAADSSAVTTVASEWDEHREQIIQLYWNDELTISEVRHYMQREKGFDKSIKSYKSRLRKWGIRKNLKKDEATQLASGKAVSKFWPDRRGDEYLRRVARHIGQKRQTAMTSRQQARQTAQGFPHIPAQIYTRDLLETIEIALFSGNLFLQGMGQSPKGTSVTTRSHLERPNAEVSRTTTSSTQSDDRFFELFNQGIEDLAQARQSRPAFANLNAAFDFLNGLLLANHPIIFFRLAAQVLCCKAYPASPIARKVCRMAVVHLLHLSRLVLGPGHPINNWWPTCIKLLDSEQWDYMDLFLEGAQRLGSKYIAYVPGTVDLLTYVPSDMRGEKDDVLREKISHLSTDMSRVAEAQEARLCLAELLLGQGEIQEGLQILREALRFRDLDSERPEEKAFWFSELFSRAGEVDESLGILKEATDPVKGEDETSQPRDVLLLKREPPKLGSPNFQIPYRNTGSFSSRYIVMLPQK